MRKLFFYLFIVRKAFLLLVYPAIERKGTLFELLRKRVENFLIFQPSKLRARKIQSGLLKNINPQRFVNSEGIKLYAWFIKPKKNNPVFLHLHGQAESILSHQDVALYCLKHGLGLFSLSYRGHYKSGGTATEQGLYDDAQAAILQLKKLGVDSDKIILWGHSLGTSVAVETALKNQVSGVILQSPIKEIKSAAVGVFQFYCKRLGLEILSPILEKHINRIDIIQKMDNINKIENIECPILIVHPKSDKVAPFNNSVELAQKNPKAQLYLSELGNHWDAEWCFERVHEFAKSLDFSPA